MNKLLPLFLLFALPCFGGIWTTPTTIPLYSNGVPVGSASSIAFSNAGRISISGGRALVDVGTGGAGGGATNAVATIKTNNVDVLNGAVSMLFTNNNATTRWEVRDLGSGIFDVAVRVLGQQPTNANLTLWSALSTSVLSGKLDYPITGDKSFSGYSLLDLFNLAANALYIGDITTTGTVSGVTTLSANQVNAGAVTASNRVTISGTGGYIAINTGTNAVSAAPTNYVLNPILGAVQWVFPTNNINIVHLTNQPTTRATNITYSWVVDTRGLGSNVRLSWPSGFNRIGTATTNDAVLVSNKIHHIDFASYGPGDSNTSLAIGFGQ